MTPAAHLEHYVGLLREARAALPPEFYDLAGRIDDSLPSTLGGEPILGSLPDHHLVLEELPNGELAWLRSETFRR